MRQELSGDVTTKEASFYTDYRKKTFPTNWDIRGYTHLIEKPGVSTKERRSANKS